jgi:hypothetical protein
MLALGFMVFNTTFNNISVISWRSALLVKETGIPDQNHRPAASHYIIAKKLSGISNIFCKFILRVKLALNRHLSNCHVKISATCQFNAILRPDLTGLFKVQIRQVWLYIINDCFKSLRNYLPFIAQNCFNLPMKKEEDPVVYQATDRWNVHQLAVTEMSVIQSTHNSHVKSSSVE